MVKITLIFLIVIIAGVFIWNLIDYLAPDRKRIELKKSRIKTESLDIEKEISKENSRQKDISSEINEINSKTKNSKDYENASK